jgi:hypothetical protein
MSLICVMETEWILCGIRAKTNETGDGLEATKAPFSVRYSLNLKLPTNIDNRTQSIVKVEIQTLRQIHYKPPNFHDNQS